MSDFDDREDDHSDDEIEYTIKVSRIFWYYLLHVLISFLENHWQKKEW